MATTIDHLRADHHIRVLRDFTDADGVTLRAGDDGVLRALSFDQIRLEIRLEIERTGGNVSLRFPLKASTGPRNGHMREYFEIGDFVPPPGWEPPRREPKKRTMIVPSPAANPSVKNDVSDPWRHVRAGEGPDRLEAMERELQRAYPHIGAAASIAEMYAQRMRAFQRAGDEPRAVAAFKLAVQWMDTYASQATSGGEGAALSLERDEFLDGLVREFGYDPTEDVS